MEVYVAGVVVAFILLCLLNEWHSDPLMNSCLVMAIAFLSAFSWCVVITVLMDYYEERH